MKKVLLLVAGLTLSAAAAAQQNEREGMWEFGVLFNNTSSETLSGENGSSIDVDSSTGYGISLGYNFNNRLALGGDLLWNSPDYDAVLITDDLDGTPVEINHELDVFTINLKGTFNLLEGPFTPFVEAGFGWTGIDSNVQNAPPITGCWWDPWWGYICETFYSTYSKTLQQYGAAVGLRFDLANGLSIKGSYGIQEISTSKATEDLSLDSIRLDLSWRF
jgi:opacity protein-like surface antigen